MTTQTPPLEGNQLALALARTDPDPCDPITHDAGRYYRDFAAALTAAGYRIFAPDTQDAPTRPGPCPAATTPADEHSLHLTEPDARSAVKHLRHLADRETATTADHAAACLTVSWLADQIERLLPDHANGPCGHTDAPAQ